VSGGLSRRGPFLLSYALDQQVRELLLLTFDDAPLQPAEFAIYSVLLSTGECTPSELAQILGMGRSTLSNWLRRMGSRGHLRRRRNPADGRSQLVSLTASGRRVTERSMPAFARAIGAFRAELAVDEDAVLGTMEAMSAALAAAIERLADDESSSPEPPRFTAVRRP
jgi:DNA-binding MarR family transcriptional regulator